MIAVTPLRKAMRRTAASAWEPFGYRGAPPRGGILQRKCACGNHTMAGGECASCGSSRGTLQRKAAGETSPRAIPPVVHDVLRSPGRPLDASTRAFMEPRFGHNFSRVRVHSDPLAAESANAVSAKAYTVGDDVVFAPGQYAPATSEGRRLFAHELTHVIQQERSSGSVNTLSMSQSGPDEQEADRIASAVESRDAPMRVGLSTPRRLARQEANDDELTRALRQLDAAQRNMGKPKQEQFYNFFQPPAGESPAAAQTSAAAGQPPVDVVGMIAEQGVSMEASYRKTHFKSDREAIDFMDRYIAYTKDKPHLQAQYQEAVAARKRILAERDAARRKAVADRQREQQQQAEIAKNKEQWQKDYELSQRTPPALLSMLGPAHVQAYYRNPSSQIQNPLLKQQADLATAAAAGHGALATSATAVAAGTVAAATVIAIGALTLPVVVSIATDAVVGSTTLTPVVSAVLSNPIAAEEIAKFGFGVVLSIAAAGGVKNYLDQISTPEGALQVAFELFVLHATIQGSGGGPSRPVTLKGKVDRATPNGFDVHLIEDASEHPAVQGGRAANTNAPPPDNVVPLPRPQAVPRQKVVGQSFDPDQATTGPNAPAAGANRPVAAAGGGGSNLRDIRSGPRTTTEAIDELGDVGSRAGASRDRPPVRVENYPRGDAIEREHLDSMPDFSRPKTHDFPGIDGWKGGTTRNTAAGKVIVYGADVVQIKSVGSSNPDTIRATVRAGVSGLDANRYEQGNLSVINPASRRLDVLFEEGALPDVNAQTRALLTDLSANAGNSGVAVRWFRYSNGTKSEIPITAKKGK